MGQRSSQEQETGKNYGNWHDSQQEAIREREKGVDGFWRAQHLQESTLGQNVKLVTLHVGAQPDNLTARETQVVIRVEELDGTPKNRRTETQTVAPCIGTLGVSHRPTVAASGAPREPSSGAGTEK